MLSPSSIRSIETADLWETVIPVDPTKVIAMVLEAKVGSNLVTSPQILPGGKMNVGRATDTGMSVYYDRQMSRSHFSIEFRGDHAVVRDLHSTNGTFVQGVCVNETRVYDGDMIAAGNTKFKVRLVR